MRSIVLALVISVGSVAALEARPIRTNTPGTGVFIGTGLVSQILCEESSQVGSTLSGCTLLGDFRYTPATHWVLGVRAPLYVEREVSHQGRGWSRSGVGDVELSTKYRFFRQVGPWFDRHAAIEVGAKLPTGESRIEDGSLPATLAHRLAPGTGSTDYFAELIYQQGQGRFVWGGGLQYRRNGTGEEGYRFGDVARLSFDLEYIAFPREYKTPGKEVFLLLEGALVHRSDDEFVGAAISTGGTELLLAPGVQHIASEQMLLSLSLQFPVWSDLELQSIESDWSLLVELRFAF
ncbi:MAG: hypothetical protein DWQ36_16580 [Acidobacteria bacterium]|nr:MAG: hypothetical protein DWQ30_14750 [Acidobacteriota bacterium]REK04470.1 MAG: hypothetical protein DWQ36_16580 [Acidobacteriota bacterium]